MDQIKHRRAFKNPGMYKNERTINSKEVRAIFNKRSAKCSVWAYNVSVVPYNAKKQTLQKKEKSTCKACKCVCDEGRTNTMDTYDKERRRGTEEG